MNTKLASGLVLGGLLFAACGAPDPGPSFNTDPPSGVFAGEQWTMTHATIQRESDGQLDVNLFAEDPGECSEFPSQDSTLGYIIFNMPAELGRRELQLSLSDFSDPDNQTVTFVTPPSNNNISVDGVLELQELTDTTVKLAIIARSGDDYEVNGTVNATLCPE